MDASAHSHDHGVNERDDVRGAELFQGAATTAQGALRHTECELPSAYSEADGADSQHMKKSQLGGVWQPFPSERGEAVGKQ